MTTTQLAPRHGPAARPSTLTRSVPSEYVHKAAVAEVLITGWERTAPDAFTLTAQWPRAHSFYTSRNGRHDPLLFVETIRQTIPLLSHMAYDVPFGHHQIWKSFHYTLDSGALRTETSPVALELRATCADVRSRGGHLASLSLEIEAFRDGERLGTAQTCFSNHNHAVYRRLRGGHAGTGPSLAHGEPLTPPVPPSQVARDRSQDVVLSPTGTPRRWRLRADATHPVLFDHQVDHAPGMLLLEAARQAAHSVAHSPELVPVGMESDFSRFAELDADCWIEAQALPAAQDRARIRVTAHQEGQELFATTVTAERADSEVRVS
ncbi:ScbA/BarX family gamma-butyrolactone biosynthesis protein [Streptomyces sp. NPDC050161]|uniref:ScbA/BarX family gamma-butyrolactone biosynthesis protein n=1 Tax=Streptomyces sp. NPDC050161 TaxID=3365604 RepID=UPI0037AE5659